MMERINISSGAPYEKQVGYSRAVRIGNQIAISGTAPIADDGSPAHPGDLYKQTIRCLDIIFRAIRDAGGKPEHIIRTRVYLTDVSRWEEAAKAHGESFSDIRPACTFIEVSALLDKQWLVEIEADCILAE